jgi:hypothetical protein
MCHTSQAEAAARNEKRKRDKEAAQPVDLDLAQDALWNEGAQREAEAANKEGVAVIMDDDEPAKRRRKVVMTDEQLRRKEQQAMRESRNLAGT